MWWEARPRSVPVAWRVYRARRRCGWAASLVDGEVRWSVDIPGLGSIIARSPPDAGPGHGTEIGTAVLAVEVVPRRLVGEPLILRYPSSPGCWPSWRSDSAGSPPRWGVNRGRYGRSYAPSTPPARAPAWGGGYLSVLVVDVGVMIGAVVVLRSCLAARFAIAWRSCTSDESRDDRRRAGGGVRVEMAVATPAPGRSRWSRRRGCPSAARWRCRRPARSGGATSRHRAGCPVVADDRMAGLRPCLHPAVEVDRVNSGLDQGGSGLARSVS